MWGGGVAGPPFPMFSASTFPTECPPTPAKSQETPKRIQELGENVTHGRNSDLPRPCFCLRLVSDHLSHGAEANLTYGDPGGEATSVGWSFCRAQGPGGWEADWGHCLLGTTTKEVFSSTAVPQGEGET